MKTITIDHKHLFFDNDEPGFIDGVWCQKGWHEVVLPLTCEINNEGNIVNVLTNHYRRSE